MDNGQFSKGMAFWKSQDAVNPEQAKAPSDSKSKFFFFSPRKTRLKFKPIKHRI